MKAVFLWDSKVLLCVLYFLKERAAEKIPYWWSRQSAELKQNEILKPVWLHKLVVSVLWRPRQEDGLNYTVRNPG